LKLATATFKSVLFCYQFSVELPLFCIGQLIINKAVTAFKNLLMNVGFKFFQLNRLGSV